MSAGVATTAITKTGMDESSKRRNFFEIDVVFESELVKPILAAYEEACKLAERDARRAIKSGRPSDLRTAQWSECIAQTIEEILCCIPHSDLGGKPIAESEFSRPSTPDFTGGA